VVVLTSGTDLSAPAPGGPERETWNDVLTHLGTMSRDITWCPRQEIGPATPGSPPSTHSKPRIWGGSEAACGELSGNRRGNGRPNHPRRRHHRRRDSGGPTEVAAPERAGCSLLRPFERPECYNSSARSPAARRRGHATRRDHRRTACTPRAFPLCSRFTAYVSPS
jgi:hypothetical protein